MTVMRTDITPEEHALLLAVRAMNTARQARADTEAQVTAAIAHLDYAAGLAESTRYESAVNRAIDTHWTTKRAFEDALSATDTTGEGDCS